MRYSRLTSTLLSGAFILILLGSVSANSRTKMTAEFDLMPSLEKAGRVEKAKRQGNPIIKTLPFLWEKNSDLLPLHCRVIAVDTANLAANDYGPLGDDSLISKKNFSPKMQQRHSDRWFEPPSNSGKKTSDAISTYLRSFREWLSFVSIPDIPLRDSCAKLIQRMWMTANSFGNRFTSCVEAKYERRYGDQVTIDPVDPSLSNPFWVIASSNISNTANLACRVNLDFSLNPVIITEAKCFNLFNASHCQSYVGNDFESGVFSLDYSKAITLNRFDFTLPGPPKVVSKPTKSLREQVIALCEVEMKNWADSFRHIAKQFSRLREVF